MTKTELIKEVADRTGHTLTDVDKIINTTLDTITDALVEKDSVVLTGFGTFETRERAARKGINPQTKEPLDIPASTAAAFRAGKGLKDAVNK